MGREAGNHRPIVTNAGRRYKSIASDLSRRKERQIYAHYA